MTRHPGITGLPNSHLTIYHQNAILATTNIYLAVPDAMLFHVQEAEPPVSRPSELGLVFGLPTPMFRKTMRLNGLYISHANFIEAVQLLARQHKSSTQSDLLLRVSPLAKIAITRRAAAECRGRPHSVQAAWLRISCLVGSIFPFERTALVVQTGPDVRRLVDQVDGERLRNGLYVQRVLRVEIRPSLKVAIPVRHLPRVSISSTVLGIEILRRNLGIGNDGS